MSKQASQGALRVILAKPGLDGHDRGIKVIAMALREVGAEVVYLGLRCSASEIASAAVEEDADVVGISVLSGAHMELTEQLLEAMGAAGARAAVVVGGTVPESDLKRLKAMGVADVLPVGTALDEVVARVQRVASKPAVAR
jgi:methylmalonyl-CoA mutase C-terminal domain/subunit